MRLSRCILAELGLVFCLLLAAGGATQRLGRLALVEMGRRTGPAADMRRVELDQRRDPSTESEPEIALEPSGTFLGMDDDVLLERLRTQPISRLKVKGGGSSLSFRMEFADGTRAAWKPAQTNLQTIPRKEVAAYRLNRLLGLNAVPPAAPRAVSRDELFAALHPESVAQTPRIQKETVFDPSGKTAGVASYWIPEIKDSGLDTPQGVAEWGRWLTQGQTIPPERLEQAAQLSDMVVFDFLTSNPDRYSGGNMKMSPDGARLWFMDNTMSFFVQPDGNDKTRPMLMRTQRFSRRLVEALDRLDYARIRRAIEAEAGAPFDILTPAEIKAVITRRDYIKRHISELVSQHGSGNVLSFP